MKHLARKSRVVLLFLVIAGALGIFLIRYVTPWGPGVGSDATVYVFSARNLLAGHGLGTFDPQGRFQLITHYAPFFPLVLSFVGWFGVDPLVAAQWLNAFFFGVTIFLLGFVFYRLTNEIWITALLCGLLLIAPDLLNTYAWAMSEPLFIVLSWLGLLMLWADIRHPAWEKLLVAAVLVGLAYLTRYVGVALVGCGVLTILLLSGAKWKQKFLRASLFGLIAVLPTFSWWGYYYSRYQGIANRAFNSAHLGARFGLYWQQSRDVILSWTPFIQTISANNMLFMLLKVFLILGVFIGAVLAILFWRKSHQGNLDGEGALRFFALLGLYVACYLGFLALTRLFTDPPVTLDDRMFSPIHISACFLIALLSAFAFKLWPSRWLRGLILSGLIALLGAYSLRAADFVNRSRSLGLGLSGPRWRDSQTLQAVSELPQEVEIITNEGAAVLFYTGRPISVIGELFLSAPLPAFTCYGDGTMGSDKEERFRNNGAALVLFDSIYQDFEPLYQERTVERVEAFTSCLRLYFRGADGAIYFYPTEE